MELVLLHRLLDPPAEVSLGKGREQLGLGRLEGLGQPLGLAVFEHFRPERISGAGDQFLLWREWVESAVREESEPAAEEGGLGQAGRGAALLWNRI